jgi:RNA polymerase sigma factor (sigma-70 family)
MTSGKGTALLRVIRKMAERRDSDQPSDRDLLGRFSERGDEDAFAELVRRHSSMVLGVGQRVLRHHQDAEEVCQATFLLLARKAGRVAWHDSVANWLYGAAYRLALRQRDAAQRRSAREANAQAPGPADPLADVSLRDLQGLLDEELNRLPGQYRMPLVLCCLEGKSRDEAARCLGVPLAAVKSRLEEGRALLRRRLARRGLSLSAALVGTTLFPSAARATVLIREGIHAVWPAKFRIGLPLLLTSALLGAVAAGMQAGRTPARDTPARADDKSEPHVQPDLKTHTIAGKVIAADGKPAAAELILLRSNGSPLPLGKSGEDGRFRVAVPFGAADAHLVARLGKQGVGYAAVSPRTGDVTLRLTKDNLIRGRVIDTQGKPVAGAVIFPRSLEDFGPQGVDHYLDYIKHKQTFWGRLPGQNNLYLGARTELDLPGGPVLSAKTGKDGRFEIAGLGADRVVALRSRAAGLADAEVIVVNRDKFDPSEVNKAADTRERVLPKEMRNAGHEPAHHGPEVLFVVEPEKVIRGVVKDRDTGRPRPGVKVILGRAGGRVLDHALTATTDQDGRFSFRGCRKLSDYMPEIAADVETGYLPAQVEVQDTVGYEPIDLEIACVRGVVVTGRMTDKATGKPLAGTLKVVPMRDNPHLKTYPTMDKSVYGGSAPVTTSDDGSFRFVAMPGPVLVMAGLQAPRYEVTYKQPQADPKYPDYFLNFPGRLSYTTPNGGVDIVHGCWCRVIDLKGSENGLTLNVELEPAAKKALRVVGTDGKPVEGCVSTGSTAREMYSLNHETDKVVVYGLGPKDQRFVVVGHLAKKLIGAAVVRESDKDPVVTVGPGGLVTGRVVGANGKPIADVTVGVMFDHPAVENLAEGIRAICKTVVTDAEGKFRIDTLVPGHGFRLRFSKGAKNYAPHPNRAPRHKVEKHGDTLKLGDVKAEPRESATES